MRPLSVAYFTNVVVRGGAEEHILTLLRGLDRSRFRPHLVCTPELAGRLSGDVPADVPVFRLSLRKPRQLATALRLQRLLEDLKTDVLHSHLFYSSLFASPLGRLAGVPVIVETPHVRELWRHGWVKSRFVIDRLAGCCVDRYIAVSEANARYLVEHKGLPPHKVSVIRNGCDLSRFDPRRTAPPGLREALGFLGDDPVLMVLGRLEPQKGHRVLLDALPAVRRRFPAVRLVCVGEGALRSELEAQARRLGIDEAVRFAGYQANVADWLALADVTVLPSFYEGLPLVAIESLAAGRPVVATRVDGTPEVVVDGRTGLTVPPGNAHRLAEALCRLLANAARRSELAAAGRAWVERRFDEDEQVRETQRLYVEAWEERHRLTAAHAAWRASRA